MIAAKNKNKHTKQTKQGNQRATMENSTQETTLSSIPEEATLFWHD